jgi:hypothetical protein
MNDILVRRYHLKSADNFVDIKTKLDKLLARLLQKNGSPRFLFVPVLDVDTADGSK